MSPSNLGIVFGPSLMRPRPTGATISLSSLVDYPHQARIVEALIVFYSSIFQSKSSQSHKTARTASTSTQQVSQAHLCCEVLAAETLWTTFLDTNMDFVLRTCRRTVCHC